MKIRGIAKGLLGVIAGIGLAVNVSATEFKHPYGELMIIEPRGNHLIIQYDTDGIDRADLLMHYDLKGISKEGKMIYELNFVREDKNRDGVFTKDEETYKNPKFMQQGGKSLIPRGLGV